MLDQDLLQGSPLHGGFGAAQSFEQCFVASARCKQYAFGGYSQIGEQDTRDAPVLFQSRNLPVNIEYCLPMLLRQGIHE